MRVGKCYECAPLPVYGLAGMSLDENRVSHELTSSMDAMAIFHQGDTNVANARSLNECNRLLTTIDFRIARQPLGTRQTSTSAHLPGVHPALVYGPP
jgi:hypothetical protein